MRDKTECRNHHYPRSTYGTRYIYDNNNAPVILIIVIIDVGYTTYTPEIEEEEEEERASQPANLI